MSEAWQLSRTTWLLQNRSPSDAISETPAAVACRLSQTKVDRSRLAPDALAEKWGSRKRANCLNEYARRRSYGRFVNRNLFPLSPATNRRCLPTSNSIRGTEGPSTQR